jgi:RNA polymerase sigma-70 factor (ECF subfamily)
MTQVHTSPTDADEFTALLTPLLQPAYTAAFHLTRNGPDAEDLVQEAAYLAFRAFHTFEKGTRFKAWFFRILVNSFYTTCRKKKSRPETVDVDDAPSLYLYTQAAAAGLVGPEEDPASAILGRIEAEQVQKAIARLPDEYRVVAALYFVEDFSYEEIAHMVGCPIGTVRSRLHRGRRLLQKALWSAAEEIGIVSTPTGEEASQ